MSFFVLPIILITIALLFEFINGFHDAANAVATSVSTKSLEPAQAILVSAIFNLVGACSGTAVAMTITGGFADPSLATHSVILAALLSAITWNLVTWYFGIPSSSSHALIGGLIGGIVFEAGYRAINYSQILYKVVIPMVISPIFGFILAILIVVLIHRFLINNTEPRKTNNFIREIQIVSTAFLSFSHGSNDAQKTMGIITLVLLHAHLINTPHIPLWVILICAVSMALGTLSGGIKIIKTLSTRVAKLKPINGFAVELSSAVILFIASRFGMPLSTTHAVSGAIMGGGHIGKPEGLNWGIVKQICIAWSLTFPICVFLACAFSFIIHLF